jgi:radical SAM protein with 4Fe4S-binding SPASM domain
VILHKNIINVGYNIQASSDAKHKLLIEYDTGDVNDTHALASMALQTKEILGVESLKVLADKGYHTGEELEQCHGNDITTFVSPKAPATKDTGLYPIADFTYDPDEDLYICPQGNQMRTNGKWHRHSDSRRKGKSAYRFQRYTTPACKSCKSRHLCTKSKANGRYIDRSEYADIIEANAQRVNANPDYYRRRQQITEHPFGTLKRQRGFTHTNVRGKEKVLGEVGILFIGYNLTRCVSIFGIAKLIKALRECCLLIFAHTRWLILNPYNEFLFPGIKIAA